jgi:hypothetical protein
MGIPSRNGRLSKMRGHTSPSGELITKSHELHIPETWITINFGVFQQILGSDPAK